MPDKEQHTTSSQQARPPAGAADTTAAAPYTLINIFRVDPARQAALADRVLRTARMAAALTGFIDATVLVSTDGTRVVNYARWADESAFGEFLDSARSELAEAVSLGEPDGHSYRVAGHVPTAGDA